MTMNHIGKFFLVLFILTYPLISYSQGEDESIFSEQILDKGAGKVAIGDIDNDGINDVIKIAELKDQSMVLFRFDKAGSFKKHVLLDNINFRGDRIVLHDIDHDGDLDLATGIGINDSNGKEISLDVVWLENPMPENPARKNSWKIHKAGNQKDYIKDIAVTDIDRDGKVDIITRANRQTAIYFQSNGSRWNKEVLINHESHEGMDIGDLDKDGDIDIVLNGFWFETPDDARRGAYKKHTFDEKWFTTSDGSWRDNNAAIKVVDMNRDGLPDILISNSELPGFPISLYMASSPEAVKSDCWSEIQIEARYDYCQTLDAADVDNDGDLDVLAAKFQRNPDEGDQWINDPPYPVTVYFNTKGNARVWEKRVLSNDGMYAGVFGDVGSNGSVDIVGPRSYFTGPTKMFTSKAASSKLAMDRRKYHLPIIIDANGYTRIDKPVEVQLDFSALYAEAGIVSSFSENSLQLVEVNATGEVLNSQVPFQFDKAAAFENEKKALGTLIFLMTGTTNPGHCRYFRLYFDDEVHPQDPVKSLLSIQEIGTYEGAVTCKIITPDAQYYYHMNCGGFASIMDREGNDWISYHPNKEPESGFKGRYRGIPNITPPNFHPGSTEPVKSSKIIAEGPLRVSILTETEDKQWKAKWDIYPEYATMTLLQKGPEPYWMLYEGTPGGALDIEDYWVRSDGTREAMKPYLLDSQWTGHLPSPKWVYFGDHQLDRVLYYIHHEDYLYEDVFWHSGEGGMTVFGFGRGPTRKYWQQLANVPAHLTLGFSEVNDFSKVSERINSAYRALKISVGSVNPFPCESLWK